MTVQKTPPPITKPAMPDIQCGMRYINQKRTKTMTNATLKETTVTAISEAIKASKAESKAAGVCKEKTRTALNLLYADTFASVEKPTIKDYETARETLLAQCQLDKTWPINEKGRKVGYQKAMANSETAVWFNKAYSLLNTDLSNFKKKLEEENAVALALQLDPDKLKEHNNTVEQAENSSKVQQAFLNFVNLFNGDIKAADTKFQELSKAYQSTKK